MAEEAATREAEGGTGASQPSSKKERSAKAKAGAGTPDIASEATADTKDDSTGGVVLANKGFAVALAQYINDQIQGASQHSLAMTSSALKQDVDKATRYIIAALQDEPVPTYE
jgi:hypothetical protein